MDLGDRHSIAVFCAEEGMRFPSRAFVRKAEGMPRCVGEGGWCLPFLTVAASALSPAEHKHKVPSKGATAAARASAQERVCLCARMFCVQE